jgi:hypothetical protein
MKRKIEEKAHIEKTKQEWMGEGTRKKQRTEKKIKIKWKERSKKLNIT